LLVGAFAAVLGVLGGCKGMLKKKGEDAAPSASVAVVAPPAPVVPAAPPTVEPTPAPVALDEATVPAPQDFEDEAFEKVTPANFKAEFTRLQKEISQ
jgi:hypothetical protein